jgi:hypothetical protein
MALTQVDQGLLGQYAQYTGFKNRIINGAMVIDQRNAGASVTPTGSATYTVDRWVYKSGGVSSKASIQQNAGSVTPPAGYINYVGATSLSAYTLLTGDHFSISQYIEGLNVADLAWGTANAATVTLSFWVRSSLTGLNGGAVKNSVGDRSYPFSFTVNSANIWEQKSITIAGDTTGTWLTTNGIGVEVSFNLGAYSNKLTTANAWAAGDYYGPTGANSIVSTNAATFYITGVQLEKGSTATSFDYRPYGTELALCQRYFEKSYDIDTALGTSTRNGNFRSIANGASTNLYCGSIIFKVTKRAAPVMSGWTYAGTSGQWNYGVSGTSEATTTILFDQIGSSGCTPYMTTAATGQNSMYGHWSASIEL